MRRTQTRARARSSGMRESIKCKKAIEDWIEQKCVTTNANIINTKSNRTNPLPTKLNKWVAFTILEMYLETWKLFPELYVHVFVFT